MFTNSNGNTIGPAIGLGLETLLSLRPESASPPRSLTKGHAAMTTLITIAIVIEISIVS